MFFQQCMMTDEIKSNRKLKIPLILNNSQVNENILPVNKMLNPVF